MLSQFIARMRSNIFRDTVVDDETGEYRYTDAQIIIALEWALDLFALHTADAATASLTLNGRVYSLPVDIYDGTPIDQCITVKMIGTDLKVKEVIDPVKYTIGMDSIFGRGFYTFPERTLNLTFDPSFSGTLSIDYYKYWFAPQVGIDVLTIPKWAVSAVSYLTGAYVISSYALTSASIRQYNTKNDSGNPEQNPIKEQQKWWINTYEELLAKHEPQHRHNQYRAFGQ